MNSMMIESNIHKLSRMELLYTYISKFVILIGKTGSGNLPEQLKLYADSNDFNQVIYHQRSVDTDNTDTLLSFGSSGYEDTTKYELFIRGLSEQTIVEKEKRSLHTKEDGAMNLTTLQNPSNLEATFRTKAERITEAM